jgi:hypothetical protein
MMLNKFPSVSTGIDSDADQTTIVDPNWSRYRTVLWSLIRPVLRLQATSHSQLVSRYRTESAADQTTSC